MSCFLFLINSSLFVSFGVSVCAKRTHSPMCVHTPPTHMRTHSCTHTLHTHMHSPPPHIHTLNTQACTSLPGLLRGRLAEGTFWKPEETQWEELVNPAGWWPASSLISPPSSSSPPSLLPNSDPQACSDPIPLARPASMALTCFIPSPSTSPHLASSTHLTLPPSPYRASLQFLRFRKRKRKREREAW